jgi:predicted transposase/invertase (TIGR01784 family)
MRYRHEARAAKLIEKLYGEEEGIMRAEKAIKAIDRDYWRAARKMAEIKDSMDRAQLKYDARQEGRNEGRAEGRAEGMEKGLAEGLSKGHAEGRAETARNLKSLGVSTDLIIKSTGLSPEEIARL